MKRVGLSATGNRRATSTASAEAKRRVPLPERDQVGVAGERPEEGLLERERLASRQGCRGVGPRPDRRIPRSAAVAWVRRTGASKTIGADGVVADAARVGIGRSGPVDATGSYRDLEDRGRGATLRRRASWRRTGPSDGAGCLPRGASVGLLPSGASGTGRASPDPARWRPVFDRLLAGGGPLASKARATGSTLVGRASAIKANARSHGARIRRLRARRRSVGMRYTSVPLRSVRSSRHDPDPAGDPRVSSDYR